MKRSALPFVCGRQRARRCNPGSQREAAVGATEQVEISEQTYHRWRNQYGGMKADDAGRLRELERENARLKRIVADKELEIDALKEIAKGNW